MTDAGNSKGETAVNKQKNDLILSKPLCSILLWLVLIAASAQGQSPTTVAIRSHSGTNQEATRAPSIRLSDISGRSRLRRRAGFSLMQSRLNTSALRTAAAQPAVHGSGTVGNISMWVASQPSENSVLGDSIITQAGGNIGIGLATPMSKLAVQGMIETTLGGYKFPDGTIQTTAALSGLLSISHNQTLQGDGTSGSPLGLAIPLTLTGSGPGTILNVHHVDGGTGIAVDGSVRIRGGDVSFPGFAGLGLNAVGGNAAAGGGGEGVRAVGGDGVNGGAGVSATGGNSSGAIGGDGVNASGGDSTSFGFGGVAVRASGGLGIGAGRRGGLGIIAIGGSGQDGASPGDAGHFIGDVDVSGNLSKGGGSFKIDHPLDPENKYLYHSFVESPDMMNIYNGNVTTDASGDAIVELPRYFDKLNKDFRYQLTVIGTFAQAIVADEIRDNRFVIKTNAANVKVSWQVTGVRQDAYANKNRIKVEEEKSRQERGFYLHPAAFDQPDERGIEWARHPEMMRQMKEARSKHIEKPKHNAHSNDR